MTKQRSRLLPLLFTFGYLLTWAAAGVVVFVIAVLLSSMSGDLLAWDGAGRWIAGGTLVVAAVYELTPLKDVCLGKCRSPSACVLGSWRDGWSGAVRMGAKNGAWCVGCCWALMASLFAFGSHERRLDGRGRRPHRVREDDPVAPRRVLRDRWRSGGARRPPARRPQRHAVPHDARNRFDVALPLGQRAAESIRVVALIRVGSGPSVVQAAFSPRSG